MRNALLYLSLVGLVLTLVALFERHRNAVMREAETQAALRLLAEFHYDYLSRHQLPGDYEAELASLVARYPDLDGLRRYKGDFAERGTWSAHVAP